MNKSPSNFEELIKVHNIVTDLAAIVGECESKVVIAEREFEKAKEDDGKTDPAELVERRDSAERVLKIRKIEANRAAAKLEEAEERLKEQINLDAQKACDSLTEKRNRLEEDMRGKIKAIVGQTPFIVLAGQSVNNLLFYAEPLTKLKEATDCILNGINFHLLGQDFYGLQCQGSGILSLDAFAQKIIESESLM